MPVDQLETTQERHAYVLRLPLPRRDEVMRLAQQNGVSYNAMLNVLIAEALDARTQK